jgi:ParB/RepB/Spo0J family partition protein
MSVAADETTVRPPADSAGINALVPLAALADHPENPRTDLGDLTELTASIRAQGLFEPLIALTAEAYTREGGQEGYPAEGVTHVIVMGHRRAAAARLAELDTVPVIVRDDLAGAPAIAAMIAENRHREGLDPLAEARAMAALIQRHGWRQRRVAKDIGCSQAHVSKRMALLQLPGQARDALAAGTVSVETALELHKLTGAGEVAGAAITEAIRDLERGQHPAYAISHAKDQVRRAAAAEQTRTDLQARGIEIVTEQRRAQLGWPPVYGDTSAHTAGGCLAATISWSGTAEYVCTNPASHPEEISPHAHREARAHEDEREGRKAAKARDAVCTAIVAGPLPHARILLQQITAALLSGGGGHAESMRMAARWLAEAGVAPRGLDHYQLRDKMTADGDHAGLQRYAYAYALAGDEARVRSRWASWDLHHIGHFERLVRAGYEPTAWEQARLAEAEACVQATGTLACQACGCTGAKGCPVRYDRDNELPVRECTWDCARHKTARSPEAGRDDSALWPAGSPRAMLDDRRSNDRL